MLNKNANCYNIEKNFKYSTVINKYVQWRYYNFPNTFNWYLTTQMSIMTNKTKNGKAFFSKLFRITKFFFFILRRESTLESKVAPTKRNSSTFLLHSTKTFSNVELFSIFSQTILELIFATKIKTNQLFCLPTVKKILHILYVWTLKILFMNKRILA